MTLECINPEDLPTPLTYTQVVVATGSRLVFVAGQEPEDEHGNLVGPGDLAVQARQVFANLGRALAAADARPDQVTKITIFVVGYRRDECLPTIEEGRVALFGDHKPASRHPGGSGGAVPRLPDRGRGDRRCRWLTRTPTVAAKDLAPQVLTIARQHANDDNAGQYVAVQVGRPQISDASMQAFCVDEQTEVLTQRGWITHHSLKAGDPVLSVDPQTREIRWEPVVWTHRLEYAGPLVHWKSMRMDALTMPGHRWLIETKRTLAPRGELATCPECGMTGGKRGPFRDSNAVRTHRARKHVCRARTRTMALSWCFLCSSGRSPILVDQPVGDLPAPDPAGDVDWLAGLMQRRSLFARLVRAMFVVMSRVLGEDPPEVSFAVDEQVVEALAP